MTVRCDFEAETEPHWFLHWIFHWPTFYACCVSPYGMAPFDNLLYPTVKHICDRNSHISRSGTSKIPSSTMPIIPKSLRGWGYYVDIDLSQTDTQIRAAAASNGFCPANRQTHNRHTQSVITRIPKGLLIARQGQS